MGIHCRRLWLVALLAVGVMAAICIRCRRETLTAEVAGSLISLPAPTTVGTMSLEEAIAKRRSNRDLSGQALSREQISQLAWSAQGITDSERLLRTAPSAGALYPLELYLVTAEGIFHYLPLEHGLFPVTTGDMRSRLSEAARGQATVAQAALDVVIAAVYERTKNRYGDRGERYVHLEAGHAAQNLLLQATSLGLGAVPMGSFDDGRVASVLSLPEDCTPLYIIPIGHPAD